ncbi:hypothetical protein CBW65_04570 [Tumebacillus avium]|uniref:Flagellar protein FliT n=1 Tax=Tumebacillus avium TaxID=1903704 RepID=A0A1Y0IIT9_9BACL|nr:hypothetical protein [Tumebacillus avium]ARU60421.1 hypothetical protein CBW65_04570 [Tumebacillus avium]
MTRLEAAQRILETTLQIQAALQAGDDDRLATLFTERQDLISDYLLLEEEGKGQPQNKAEELEIQSLMKRGYELNQQTNRQLLQKRQLLYQELSMGDQMREASNAYSSPYENVSGPMFFDKKK